MNTNSHIIHLKTSLDLFKTQDFYFLMKLINNLEEIIEVKKKEENEYDHVIFIYKKDGYNEESPSSEKEIKDYLFQEIVERVHFFFYLLKLIKNFPIPILYVSFEDSLSLDWDIAYSCTARIWFNTESFVGWPEMLHGGISLYSILDETYKKKMGEKNWWDKEPILSVKDAFKEKLVTFLCNDKNNWTEIVEEWRKEHPLSVQSSLSFLLESMRRQKNIKTTEGLKQKTTIKLKKWAQKLSSTLKGKDSGNKETLNSEREKNYIKFISTHLYATKHTIEKLIREESVLPPESVLINVDPMLPPSKILSIILNKNIKIIFFSSDIEKLAHSLEQLYYRLEKNGSLKALTVIWDQKISWFVSSFQEANKLPSIPCISWNQDGLVQISWKNEKILFLRLEGNSTSAPIGYAEIMHSNPSQDMKNLLKLSGENFIQGSFSHSFLSTTLRLKVFDEIIKNVSHFVENFPVLFQHLKNNGWGFISSEERWENFLRTRYDTEEASNPADELFSLSQKEIREFPNWKTAKQSLKKSNKNNKLWNSAQTHFHLAIFSWLLFRILAKNKILQDEESLNSLVSQAIGFPEKDGNISDIINKYGLRKTTYYVKDKWPEWIEYL